MKLRGVRWMCIECALWESLPLHAELRDSDLYILVLGSVNNYVLIAKRRNVQQTSPNKSDQYGSCMMHIGFVQWSSCICQWYVNGSCAMGCLIPSITSWYMLNVILTSHGFQLFWSFQHAPSVQDFHFYFPTYILKGNHNLHWLHVDYESILPYLIPHGIMWDCLNVNLEATSIDHRYDDRQFVPLRIQVTCIS